MIIFRYRDEQDVDRFLKANQIDRQRLGWRFVTTSAVAIDMSRRPKPRIFIPDGAALVRDVDLVAVPFMRSPKGAPPRPRDDDPMARLFSSPAPAPMGGVSRAPVGVAILDSGVDRADGVDIALERRLTFNSGQPERDLVPAGDTHGTYMAYIAGFRHDDSSNAVLWSLRAETANEMAVAIDWAVAHNRNVVDDGQRIRVLCVAVLFDRPEKGAGQLLHDCIDAATRSGIVVCVAFGNVPLGDKASLPFPAAAPAAITVAAYDMKKVGIGDDAVHPFLVSSPPPGLKKPDVLCHWSPYRMSNDQSYAGTSFATAWLARAVTVWLGQNPAMKAQDVASRIDQWPQRLTYVAMSSPRGDGFPVVRSPDIP